MYAEMNDQVMKRPEAAAMLGLSECQVSRLAQAGTLPSAKIGGARRFLRSQLLEWLRAGGSAGGSAGASQVANAA